MRAPEMYIVDEAEVLDLFTRGASLQDMVDVYFDRHRVLTTVAQWDWFRRGGQFEALVLRHSPLLSAWQVADRHKGAYPYARLRAEALRRAGFEQSTMQQVEQRAWLFKLSEQDLVVDYDPATPNGFSYVPRREGIDTDLVRAVDPGEGGEEG